MMRPQARPPIEWTPSITMNAIQEYCSQTGRDLSMVALSAFGVQNISCHAGLMVEAPGRAAMPSGLFAQIAADSGCGKSSTMKAFSTSLRRFETEENDTAQNRMAEDPAAAPAPIIYHSDSTPEAVIESFRNQPATAIFTSEGMMMLDLQHRGPPPAFNDAFSGEGVRHRRISRGAVNQPDAKLAILTATQPGPLVDSLAKNNSAAFLNGYVGRGFYVMPSTRSSTPYFAAGCQTSRYRDEYNERNYEMLKLTLREKCSFTLKMNADAQYAWFGLCKQVDDWTKYCGSWTGLHQAWAMRLPEKVLRLAAQFRFSESLDGTEIDALSMQRAITWGYWFADEYLRLFGPLGWLTRDVHDAQEAWQCLCNHVTNFGNFNLLSLASIEVLCQEKLKTTARLKKALKLLVYTGQLFTVKQGKSLCFQMHPSITNNLIMPSMIEHSRYQEHVGMCH